MKQDHQAVIAVDIDGTLNYGLDRPMRERDSIAGMVDRLRILYNKGYVIILYTSRNESRRTETVRWLGANGFLRGKHYHDVVYGKLKYDIIIDASAYNPIEALKRLIIEEKDDDMCSDEAFGLDSKMWEEVCHIMET